MTNLENLSKIIKKEREKKKITIEKVSEDTNIPLKFIKYIEEGRWNEFPSKFHIKGYTKIYLAYLGLNISIDDLFKEEKEEKGEKKNENNLFYISISLFLIFIIECIFANFLLSSLLK